MARASFRRDGWRGWRLACLLVLVAALSPATASPHPANIGHRGGTVDRPENTIINFDFALENGIDWIETDVWLSSDGIPVIHHDETLDRTTNGTGFVYSKTLAELKLLDAGSWFGPAYAGTPIPTLAEALLAIQGRGKVLIEIKRIAYIPAVAQVVDSVGFPHEDLITWIRLGTHMAELYKQAIPGSRVILAASYQYGRDEQEIWQRAEAGDHGLITDYLEVDQRFVDLSHSYGLSAYAAVVTSPSFNAMINLGLDGLVVSHPRRLAGFLPGPTPQCQDGIDNDGDGLIDAENDPGCFGPEDKTESAECSDGIDNDGDGLIDYPDDPGCYSSFYPFESPECDDGIDNDGDGVTDYPLAPGCFARFDQTEATDCRDGFDNDGDGLIDHPEDPGCASPSGSSENDSLAQCDNGIDDDGDGLTDLADPGCTSASDATEKRIGLICDDGIDQDDDGLIDYPADPGCSHPTDNNERGPGLTCDNGIDEDGDGFSDFPSDPGCMDAFDTSERQPELACDDDLDQDGDLHIDYPNDPGCASPADDDERSEAFQCDNGIDDDGDGFIDFPADDGCLHPSNLIEAPEPDQGIALAVGIVGIGLLASMRRRPVRIDFSPRIRGS